MAAVAEATTVVAGATTVRRAPPQDEAGSLPLVTIVVPVLNEAKSIQACLASLLVQDYPAVAEILVLDGGSTDDTWNIVRRVAVHNPTIRLLVNPRRLQSAACNLAAAQATPDASIMVRADAHALYPDGYVTACVQALRSKGATSVVVPMRAVGDRPLQRAIAAVQNSRLGNGGSAHRQAGKSGYVEHGHHAAFDLAFFRRVGGYDETFSHNEDAELDHRMTRAGGSIWMCGQGTVDYIPRSSLKSLARQYFNHGRGRARMLVTHRIRPRPRQMAPVGILLGSVASLALTPLIAPAALLPASYAALCAGVGAVAALRHGRPELLAMGPAAITMHLAWAVGFLVGAARSVGAAAHQAATHQAAVQPPALDWHRADLVEATSRSESRRKIW